MDWRVRENGIVARARCSPETITADDRHPRHVLARRFDGNSIAVDEIDGTVFDALAHGRADDAAAAAHIEHRVAYSERRQMFEQQRRPCIEYAACEYAGIAHPWARAAIQRDFIYLAPCVERRSQPWNGHSTPSGEHTRMPARIDGDNVFGNLLECFPR